MIYNLIEPKVPKVPIVISVPHCGIEIPENEKSRYTSDALNSLDDTDWFVDKLYDFATDMGITMITAKYHRWLIDLNRNPESSPLYGDGRVITGLTPTSDFNGKPIYNSEKSPSPEEVVERLNKYYHPYYTVINEQLRELQNQFDHVLFFDAHSIRQYVPGVHPDKFPDLILGDVDQSSASSELIVEAEKVLADSNYSFAHNTPFKGGNLTRHFGSPKTKIHALQLEMSKLMYMDDDELEYNEARAAKMRVVLKQMFECLINCLNQMNTSL